MVDYPCRLVTDASGERSHDRTLSKTLMGHQGLCGANDEACGVLGSASSGDNYRFCFGWADHRDDKTWVRKVSSSEGTDYRNQTPTGDPEITTERHFETSPRSQAIDSDYCRERRLLQTAERAPGWMRNLSA